jgi:hypothetical protein
MGFLIKVGFWLGLVLVLLPRTDGDTKQAAEAVGPFEVLHTASAIIGDFAGICERRPDVCDSAGAILRTVGIRAREGAAIAITAISDARKPDEQAQGEDDADLKTGSVAERNEAIPADK